MRLASTRSVPAREIRPFLPFSAPWFGPEEKEEIVKVLDSGWITTGPQTRRFESTFAEYVGSAHAIALNSCTAALHLALKGLGIGPGDAVILPPFTFSATANVVVHCQARPLFVDIDPETYNLCPVQLECILRTRCRWRPRKRELVLHNSGLRVKAIIAVHYGGHPCDMDAINGLARQYGLRVIEDAAHALGGHYRGRPVGTLADAACFSFYPTKNITTGEGGMLTTSNDDLAQRVRKLSLHGISKDAWKRYQKEGSWRYDVEEAGFKYNMTDLAASLGLHQLRKLSLFTSRKAEIAQQYRALLDGMPLVLPTVRPNVETAWHLFPVQVRSSQFSRDQVIQELADRNIGTSVHFVPLHLTSFYRRTLGCRRGDFPVAEQVFRRIVSLPFFARMQDDDVDYVAASLREILLKT